jgi:hypothetical protein
VKRVKILNLDHFRQGKLLPGNAGDDENPIQGPAGAAWI